jgi:tetratricopeptide (TPR) repeat protein
MSSAETPYLWLSQRELVTASGETVALRDVSEGTMRLVPLLSFLAWTWHTGSRGPIDPDVLEVELGVSSTVVGQQRSTLRSLDKQYLNGELLEDASGDGGPLRDAPLRLKRQVPCDLADLLEALKQRDGRRLAELLADAPAWDRLVKAAHGRGTERGSWPSSIESSIQAARLLAHARDPQLIGRAAQKQAAERALGRGQIATLYAAPGHGTTAIARAVADNWKGPKRWVSLRGTKDAVNTLAASLEIQQSGERALEHVVAAVAAEAAESGDLLLVLDGCRAERGYRDLLLELRRECGQALAILTTSEHKILIGMRSDEECEIRVPKLAPAEAIELFRVTAERDYGRPREAEDDALVAEICRACGYIPVPITDAVKAWVKNQTLRQVLETVKASDSINASIANLPVLQREALGQLSVYAGGFDLETAASVVQDDMTEDELETILRTVMNTHLVRLDDVEGTARFELDRSVRAAGRRQLKDSGDWEEYRARLRKHLLPRVVYDPTIGRAAWLTRVASELVSVLDAIEDSPDSTSREREIHPDGLALAAELIPFWRIRGRFAEGREVLHRAAACPAAADDPALHARLLAGEAEMSWYQKLPEAKDLARRALQLVGEDGPVGHLAQFWDGLIGERIEMVQAAAQRGDDPSTQAQALTEAAWHDWGYSDFATARAGFDQAERISWDLREESLQAGAVLGLGWTERRVCRFTHAEASFHEAMDLATVLEDPTLRAEAFNALGELARVRGDHADAEAFLTQGRRHAARSGIGWIEGRLLGSLGELERAKASTSTDLRKARRTLERSLELAERQGPSRQQAWRRFGLGLVQFLLEDLPGAERHFSLSLSLAKEMHDAWQVARCQQQLARLKLVEGDPREAARELLVAGREQDRLGVLDGLGWILQDLGLALERLECHEGTALVTGAREGIERSIYVTPKRLLRSSNRGCDWYAEEVEEGLESAKAALGERAWSDAIRGGRRLVRRSRGRPRLDRVLDAVEAQLASVPA